MKAVLFFIIFIYTSFHLFAQKKLLDYSTPYSWPIISSQKISNDGKYICYTIGSARGNYLKGPEIIDSILVIQSTNDSCKWELPKPMSKGLFTEDSRYLIFQLATDSLGIFDLGTNKLFYIGQIASFQVPKDGNGELLVYQLRDDAKTLVVFNIATGSKRYSRNVEKYTISKNGKFLLVQSFDTLAGKRMNKISWINLHNETSKIIGHEYEMKSITFDKGGNKIIFLANEKISGWFKQTLRYYQDEMDSARILVDSLTPGMDNMSLGGGDVFFNDNSDKVFFSVVKRVNILERKAYNEGSKVNIWSYQDDMQFAENNSPFLAVITLNENSKVRRLQQDTDDRRFQDPQNYVTKDGSYVIFNSNTIGDASEYRWRISSRPNISLVSTKDGSRRMIKSRLYGNCTGFSPSGKFVMWYDQIKRQWFAYNIAFGTIKNITCGIHVPLYYETDLPSLPGAEGIAGWSQNDEAVFIYDRFDIWEVDPDGLRPPVNITHGYGVRNNLKLRILNFEEGNSYSVSLIRFNDTLFLSAFNQTTKDNGFFKVRLGQYGSFERLDMNPSIFYFSIANPDLSGALRPFYPLKAKNAPVYLLSKMSVSEYPNLVLTSDFVTFKTLTKLEPQKGYNWYKSQLIHWRLPDSKMAEGILYKPENFDARRKYPIIFYFYEKSSDALNFFLQPQLSNGVISIPWFVSNGYLVFVPNIYYKIGYPGESVNCSIVSAVKHLLNFPWVDGKHMGLQGHSFGGWETNYLITHTSLFAAAASANGVSDLVSMYGRFGGSEQEYYEAYQGRIGVSLWENPQIYISNSPIFRVDKVTTPLLIMHNQGDIRVPFEQGGEFYAGLCRLGKKVWLLSYDGEGHTVEDKKNALDYSIRLGQFFNYYLKEAPEPKWMAEEH